MAGGNSFSAVCSCCCWQQVSRAGQKDSLIGFFLFFPFDAKEYFYWRPEFIIQVEQKKAGLKMEIEPN